MMRDEHQLLNDGPVIWTIGHSTRTLDEFTRLLQTFKIEVLVDVRHFPGSRKFPHFDKENLAVSVTQTGSSYEHILELGGRRKPDKDSMNTGWRHPAFRAYADYMQTEGFAVGIAKLVAIAREKRTAYMCSEAVWWRCHRGLISDYLKLHGWQVLHILSLTKTEEHPYTQPARIVDSNLSYTPAV